MKKTYITPETAEIRINCQAIMSTSKFNPDIKPDDEWGGGLHLAPKQSGGFWDDQEYEAW